MTVKNVVRNATAPIRATMPVQRGMTTLERRPLRSDRAPLGTEDDHWANHETLGPCGHIAAQMSPFPGFWSLAAQNGECGGDSRLGVSNFEALYRVDGDRLWRALLAFARDPEVASDSVAEAYAQALRRGAAVNDPQAWVWRSAFRIAAGELKKRGSTTSLMPDVGLPGSAPRHGADRGPKPPPDRQRAAVVLFYYADASVRTIARRTGTSQLAVRANLSRGRKRLKQILGDRDD